MAERDELVALSHAGTPAGSSWGDVRGWRVIAGDGTLLGEVADVLMERDGGRPRFLRVGLDPAVARAAGGRQVYAPFDAARVDPESRSVHLDGVTGERATELPEQPDDAPFVDGPFAFRAVAEEPALSTGTAELEVGDEERITLHEEELAVGKRAVSAGEVRVEKRVETEEVRETVPVMREEVDVERRPLPPGASLERWEDEEGLHIPLVEEELVIEKRLVAREELVIRRRRVTEEQEVVETVRRERAEVVGPDDLAARGR